MAPVGKKNASKLSDERLSQLYRRYGAAIYRRARAILRDEAAAEDATQEVFLKLITRLDRVPDEMAVRWISRVTTNYCLNVRRNQRRQAVPVAVLPDRDGRHAEAEFVERDLSRRMMAAMPQQLRDFAVLRYERELDANQMARELKVSRRTVFNRLNAFDQWTEEFVRSRDLAA